jgi:tRNA nucleotidyltransferase (CCA-adding enzyme)
MTTGDASPASFRRDLLAQLPAATRDAVERIVAEGAAHAAVYAVGGVVRDLLLARPIVDVDLVMEYDAPTVVRAALPDAKIISHLRFRTASANVGGVRLDAATARSETYARPGALPHIAPADIDTDLRRRDFAMNAVALRLSGDAELLDPCRGIDDIAARRVRVLHDASFRDDATRIFRALRYAVRLGFMLDTHTADLLAQGRRFVDEIGGERLRREIELMLGEPAAGDALEAAHRAGALQAVHPALSWDAVRSEALAQPLAPRLPLLPYGFALLAAGATPDEAPQIIARLKLRREEAVAVTATTSMPKIAQMLRRPGAKPSGVAVLLDRLPIAAIAAGAAVEPDQIARLLALRYLEEWRHVKPMLNGDDLIALGVPAGPQVQRGLQLIRAARLDGWAADRDDERALMLRFARSIADSGAAAARIEFNLN